MNRKCLVGLATLAILFTPGPAKSQVTLGDALEMGARKLSKEEWLSMLPLTVSGLTSTGNAEFKLTFKADGTLLGHVRTLEGATSGTFGTWTIDDDGKRCIDETLSAWNMKVQECAYTMKLGDKYFATRTATDRSRKIRMYTYVTRDN